VRTIRSALLLTLATVAAFGQVTRQVQVSEQPEALVRKLYTQVISRQPIGVTTRAHMTLFAPFLSKALQHRIALTAACEADWFRQHRRTDLKPEFGWLELGIFSGDQEMAEPSAFQIKKTQTEKDGAIRIYVRLEHAESNGRPWTWQVVAIVRQEDGRYVVDDVIYLGDKGDPSEARLSQILSDGCDGAHWIGYREYPH